MQGSRSADLFPNGKVLSSPLRRARGKGPAAFPLVRAYVVGATGFEPVTSSVSGKRSPAELRARARPIIRPRVVRGDRVEAVPGIEPGYRVLQTLA